MPILDDESYEYFPEPIAGPFLFVPYPIIEYESIVQHNMAKHENCTEPYGRCMKYDENSKTINRYG